MRQFFLLTLAVFISTISLTLAPGFIGIALSYTLRISQMLHIVIFTVTETESQFNAVERVKEYTDRIPQEQQDIQDGVDPGWLREGKISFKNVVVGYREGPDVLKNLSLEVPPGSKIGVCGRTGSGKSTLFSALFRVATIRSGEVVIDGIDICKMNLSKLRKSIVIIPQEPVMFVGTLRKNLDPFDENNDEDVMQAIEDVGLINLINSFSDGLSHEVSENGENYSFGQKQMLNIARALLRKPKLLLIDEATASVDPKNDILLQKMFKTKFKNCTGNLLALTNFFSPNDNIDPLSFIPELCQ